MFDIGQFSPKLISSITFSVIALISFSLFPMIAGAGNTMSLNTKEACSVGGVRADLVVMVESEVITANKADWSKSVGLEEVATGTSEGMCAITDVSVARALNEAYWTPTGEKVKVSVAGTITEQAVLKDSEWKEVPSFFEDNTGLLTIIIGALALLIAVSPIAVLGGIGYMLLGKFQGGGGNGMSVAIIAVLGAIVGVTLLEVFVEFISVSYDAIDPERYSVFQGGLANLGVTIKRFWNIIFIASFFGLATMLFKNWYQGKRQKATQGYGESQLLT